MPLSKLRQLSPKLYALRRMRIAIDRAIESPAIEERRIASRWAAAWGELAGIPNVLRERRNGVKTEAKDERK